MTIPFDQAHRQAALERDLNVARIADALERIADRLTDALMPDTREDEEAEREPGPDDAPASPEDATAWRPVKGGRALLDVDGPLEVVVDRIYRSEGVDMAVVVDELGATFTTPATNLREPRS